MCKQRWTMFSRVPRVWVLILKCDISLSSPCSMSSCQHRGVKDSCSVLCTLSWLLEIIQKWRHSDWSWSSCQLFCNACDTETLILRNQLLLLPGLPLPLSIMEVLKWGWWSVHMDGCKSFDSTRKWTHIGEMIYSAWWKDIEWWFFVAYKNRTIFGIFPKISIQNISGTNIQTFTKLFRSFFINLP